MQEAEPTAVAEGQFQQILIQHPDEDEAARLVTRFKRTELLELLLRGTLQLNAPLQVCAYAGHWPLECSLCLDRFDLALQLLRWHADVHTAGASLPAVLQRVASRATPETGDLLRLLAASSAPPPSRPPRPPRPPPRPPIAVG
ncbi:unnamed protein product [Durusdinium trenchii]|uniref:C2H2-type domain-containing protein n=1 Tax=Durusdinium trenchii TaxID=1381693 RepID=A0ABP0LQD7_9DINO